MWEYCEMHYTKEWIEGYSSWYRFKDWTFTVCEISGGPVANGSLKTRLATGFQNPVAKMATANI